MEGHRAACEARFVAGLGGDAERVGYLVEVEKRRGAPAAKLLRLAAWEILKGNRA